MKKHWSKIETDYLVENYGKLTPLECAEALHRAVSAVKQKANRIGLSRERRNFTSEEKAFVLDNYDKMGALAISRTLGLNRESVRGLAQKLGVRMTSTARGQISTKTNTGRKLKQKTKDKIGNANRKYWHKNKCVECGVEISIHAKRCQPCELKSRGGEQHPWWNGGVTILYQMVAHMLYPTWKRPILERDKFTCQHCGSHRNLEVHHLRRFVEIRDSVIIANQNLSVDSYNDRVELSKLIISEHRLDDGITLCRSCHEKCHWEKQGELRENSNANGEDNPQPSRSNVVRLVDRKVQRLTAEETTTNKADTSALHIDSQSM
jgi:hypothetical protein